MHWLYIVLAVPVGAMLGLFFFGGLWWTVNRLSGASRPTLLFAVSFIVRVAVVLLVFYLLLMQGPFVLLAALAGFLAARMWAISRFRPQHQEGTGKQAVEEQTTSAEKNGGINP